MNLIFTSDFPATPPAVIERLQAVAAAPRIAWIPPLTDPGRFQEAREQFAAAGFDRLEYLDIDQDLDQVQIAYLHQFDVIYLASGDPVHLRYNAIRAGLAARLRHCAALGRLIVGAGDAALLLTPNVSLFRLRSESVDDVLATRGRFDALGAVSYELLPHADRVDAAFMEKVRGYSERTEADIVALAGGAAVFPTATDSFAHTGPVTRYRRGEIIGADARE